MLEELLPEDVWREPQPVLSIQGGVDWDPGIHDRLIQSLHAVSLDLASMDRGPLGGATSGVGASSVPFRFLSLDKAVVFPPKKPPSPLKGPDGRPLDGYVVKGLLKSTWVHKHVAQLPSAAILVAPLDMAWPLPEWLRREQQLLQDLDRLRAQLGPRDVRVFTLLVRAPSQQPSQLQQQQQEERELEERLMNLRRRLPAQYDNRLLYVLADGRPDGAGDGADLAPTAPAMRRLYKHVRDASSGYYFLAAKRVQRVETALSRHTQAPLVVRYRLKVAFWSEFLGGADKALKHYRKAFEALLDMNAMLHTAVAAAASVGPGAAGPGAGGGYGGAGPMTPGGGGAGPVLGLGMSGSGALAAGAAGAAGGYQLSSAHVLGGWLSQVKAVAELVNFKLCYYALREARHAEAVAQFRQLLQTWCWRVVRPPRIPSSSAFPPTPPPPLPSSTPSAVGGGLSLGTPRDGGGLSSPPPTPARRLDFLHHEWTSRQYQLFAALLQRFPAPPPGALPPPTQPIIPGLGLGLGSGSGSAASAAAEAEAYTGPDHHLFNAALHTARERGVARFLAANPRTDSKFAARVEASLGMVEGQGQQGSLLLAPLYLGGRPRLVDPSLEEGRLEADVLELVQLVMEREEARKPLDEAVRRLLARAAAAFDPSRPLRQRFKGLQHLQLADELAAAQLPAEAWPHYCAALRRYSEEATGGGTSGGGGGGWHLLTAAVLLRARACALAVGKAGHYLDLTLRLLSQGLRPALGAGDRRLLQLEALYLLYGLPDVAQAAMAAAQGEEEVVQLVGLPNVFIARFPPSTATEGPSSTTAIVYDDGATGEDSGADPALALEPLLLPAAEGPLEAALDCGAGGRQLLSFSVAFPEPAAAMGAACPLVLRVVSHLPLPLRPARLLLRFNKDYLGTVTVLDDDDGSGSGSGSGKLSPTDRLRASLSAPPSATTTGSGCEGQFQEVDENGTARAGLLLLPDTPLDLRLAVPVPTHELVEIGDLLHAVSLHLLVDAPPAPPAPLPCGARAFARPLRLSLPSGVACLDGASSSNTSSGGGIVSANVCCRQGHGPGALVVAQPASLPLPMHVSLRGFPAVEVIRPLASATLGLAGVGTAPASVVDGSRATQPGQEEEEEQERGPVSVATLVGHMHCLWVRVESRRDRLGAPMLYVRSDPPPPSAAPEDALFFRLGPDGRTHVPLKLGRERQPEAALSVLELAGQGQGQEIPPESSLLVPVWVRAAQEGQVKINMVLVYHSASIPPSAATGLSPTRRAARAPPADSDADAFSNLMVSSEFVLDLDAYPPFAPAFDVASPCPAAPPAAPGQQDALAASASASSGAGPPPQHTLFTGEEVVMRFTVRSLALPNYEPSPPTQTTPATATATATAAVGRPRIQSVVWWPEEGAAIAAAGKAGTGGNGGRVLYAARTGEEPQQQQQQQQQQPPQQEQEDVLALCFHFRCPATPSTHPLPLGRMRIHWTAAASSSACSPSSSSASSWVSHTDVPCPSVAVVRPDLAVHLQAPLEVRAGQPFTLAWTLESLVPDRPLDLRVLVAEGGGGALGVSSEEALVFGGVRDSVVQVLPRRTLKLPYRAVALVTGPVALPRLVLTPLPGPGAEAGAEASQQQPPSPPPPPPLRVSYRYVDNVMSAAASASAPPPTPSTGPDQPQQAPAPADTRHIFVLPPAGDGGDPQ